MEEIGGKIKKDDAGERGTKHEENAQMKMDRERHMGRELQAAKIHKEFPFCTDL